MKGKYMAYVGSYSYTGKAKGITVFDVDLEKGLLVMNGREIPVFQNGNFAI